MGTARVETGSYNRTWKHLAPRISNLIRSTKDFIVFIDIKGEIDWETTPAYDDSLLTNKAFIADRFARLIVDIAVANTIPLEGVEQSYRTGFKVLIAETFALTLDFDYAAAERAMSEALTFARARNEEKSRLWYLRSSLMAAVPCIVSALGLVLLRDSGRSILGSEGYWLALATCAGGVGALFSIIIRTGKLQLNEAAGFKLHVYEASSRIIAGCISGLLAGLAVRSHLVVGTITEGTQANLLMLTIALAAGTGERFAASIISKVQPVRNTPVRATK